MRPRAVLPPASQVSLPPARGHPGPRCPRPFPVPPSLQASPAPSAAPGRADSRVPRVDSIMLLEEGFQVTSVDASDKMLKYALKERWERRKEEPFDRWGAGAVGAGRGLRTPTPHPSALSTAPRSAQAPHLGLPLARWPCCGDLPVPAARQRQAMVLACLAAGQRPEPAPTGAWEGLGDAGMGSCGQGRLLDVPALTHFHVLQSSRRPTGSRWRRTWRSQGMGLMQSSASGTPLHTCLTSKVSWGQRRGEGAPMHVCIVSSSRLRTCPNSCH